MYIHICNYVSHVLCDEALDSQTADNVTETRVVSTSVPCVPLSYF